jgi:predicted secreted Zn-dependent protease
MIVKKFAAALATSLTAIVFAVFSFGTALASPAVSTKYKTYSVPGKSAQQLFAHMSRYGPHVNGSPALATTAANITHSAKLNRQKRCRLKNYKMNMSFIITLPKARNQSTMSKSQRKRWNQFSAHAKWHELQHRTIWIKCARHIERKVRKMRAQRTCEMAWSIARKIANSELEKCDAKHSAFDKRESKRAARLPLIAQAMRPQRKHATARTNLRKVAKKSSTRRRMGRMDDDR